MLGSGWRGNPGEEACGYTEVLMLIDVHVSRTREMFFSFGVVIPVES